jgi:acyl-CoA reductase-like NAD-dependent aldehyde dehydrogenase
MVSVATDVLLVENLIGGVHEPASGGATFEKIAPSTGELLCLVAQSGAADVERAVEAAVAAQPEWAARTPVDRGRAIRSVAGLMGDERELLAELISAETGKSPSDAAAEVDVATEFAYFMAGEGRRFYGKTIPSATPHREAFTIRQPLGVAGVIVAANTPLTNIAWKVFPALLCGNAVVVKASEHAPLTALAFARLATRAGLPPGVLDLIHGYGPDAGMPLVADPRVDVVSFTGSTPVGRVIARVAGARLAKVSLALGGKNPFVVCDDADLAGATEAALLSAFSNAGQRCASGSRLIVFAGVYDEFIARLLARLEATPPGGMGPVMTEQLLERILGSLDRAREAGARLLIGGERLGVRGFFLEPTLVENVPADSDFACSELFGPVASIHRVRSFEEALTAANASPYGLTAAVWTRSISRAQEFVRRIVAGGVQVNGPSYGFEPHVPFGGERDSGTGWREAGSESLDVYSDWKTVYVTHDPAEV